MKQPRPAGRHLLACLAAALLLVSSPLQAQDSPEDPLAQAEEGMRHIMTALQLLLASIPQYEMPQVLENGDIIIRRVQPEPPADPPADPHDANNNGVDETTI